MTRWTRDRDLYRKVRERIGAPVGEDANVVQLVPIF